MNIFERVIKRNKVATIHLILGKLSLLYSEYKRVSGKATAESENLRT
jgi:hypothetical protein